MSIADLVGFTARAEQMDPEDVRARAALHVVRGEGEALLAVAS
jgi:class 3 adenylate cyclase